MEDDALSENEPEPAKNENQTILIAWAIIIGLFLITVCAGSILWLTRLKAAPQTPKTEFPAAYLPTAYPPTSAPIIINSIKIPLILSGHTPVWKVTNVKSLGYKSGGRRNDLATFMRVDNQATAQGYCINRGLDTPAVGTEYMLTAGNIFVPLHEPKANTLQRFQLIK